MDGFRWSAVAESLTTRHTAQWAPLVQTAAGRRRRGPQSDRRWRRGARRRLHDGRSPAWLGCWSRPARPWRSSTAISPPPAWPAAWARRSTSAGRTCWRAACRWPRASIHSLDDRIALLPLVQGGAAAAEKLDAIHASVTAGVLRYHYDIVLFDLGAVDRRSGKAPTARRIARRCRLDGVLLIAAPAATAAASIRSGSAQAAPELASDLPGRDRESTSPRA